MAIYCYIYHWCCVVYSRSHLCTVVCHFMFHLLVSFCLHGSWYFRTVASHCHFLFQWCSVQWRNGSENTGCQETKGAHLHLQCYHLIFITNKNNFQKKVEAKRCNSNLCNNYLFINYSIHVWLKSVRSLTQIRIKKIYHQHARVLVDMFYNRQSVYLRVQTVLLFSPTCSLIRMRQTSCRGSSRKTKRS